MVIEVTFDVTDVYISTTVSPVYVNVSFEAPSGGGGAVWGDITGTLSNQTDLQTALDLKVPYTGATANVDLGEYELKAGQVEFDQTPTGTAGVGVMRWNDSDGTLDLGLKGGNVTLQLGQEQVARVVNKSGVNLLESAYQVVKVTDAQGQRLTVDLAQGNNDANSTDTIGIVTENIDNNQEGFITTSGIVRNINTTGSLQGETWNDGDVLYLSPTTAGAITNIKPTAPNHTVILGYVVYAHAVNGKIFTKCDNGYEIGELHDCYLPTPSNNDGIFWNSTNLRYENKSVSSALGYTPANAATTITINGVSYDLSTSRTWSVGTVTGSGASGQVAYWTGTSAQSGSNNLFWDATNSRLGIGTNAPAYDFDLVKFSNSDTLARFKNTNSVGQTTISVYNDINEYANYSIFSSNSIASLRNKVFLTAVTTNGFGFSLYNNSSTANFSIITTTSLTERFRLFGNTGNVLIQNGGTFTDSGERLQVTGTAKITSKLSMGAGTTSNAQINLASSTAPTSPANGDIWFDGTDIKMRIGGVTKTFTLT
jgi:hypothetical protein